MTASPNIRLQKIAIGRQTITFAVDARLADPIGRALVEGGAVPETPLRRIMIDALQPGGTMLDVGAHIGTYAVTAAALGCRVVAVEAGADNVALLEATAQANRFADFRVVAAAASDRSGTIAFGPHLAWGHVRKTAQTDDVPLVAARAVAVDELLAEVGWDRADLVKVNAEGWDLRVMQGMERTLRRPDGPMLCFVANAPTLGWYGDTPDRLLTFVAACGYRIYSLHGGRRPRAIAWHVGDLQPEASLEYVALREAPARLGSWTFEASVSARDMAARIDRAAANPYGPYRRATAAALAAAQDRWAAFGPVEAARQRLSQDPDPSVQRAARSEEGGGDRPSRDPYLDRTPDDSTRVPTISLRSVSVRDGLEVTFASDDDPDDSVASHLVEQGVYVSEPPTWLALDLLRAGATFVDVGAHVGTFTLPAAALGCRVLAVEASARNVALLHAAVAANRFDNVRIVQAAASDGHGSLAFSPHLAWGHVRKQTEPDEIASVDVPAVRLDGLLAELGWATVDLIKMDVEGWEPRALAGLSGLFERPNRPTVLLEVNGPALQWYGCTPDSVLTALAAFGYQLFMVDRRRPGDLVEYRPGDWQPAPIEDYVAFPGRPPALGPRWRVQPPLSHRECVDRVVAACADPHIGYRAFTAGALREAPRELLENPAIQGALRALREDAEPLARQAAAWSRSVDGPEGVRRYIEHHRPILEASRTGRRAHPDLPGALASIPHPYVVSRRFADVMLDVIITDVTATYWYDVLADARFADLEFIRAQGLIAPGDVVFDVGAHQGVYALCFAVLTGPTGHVYAFEPVRAHCDLITLNAQLNGLTNITVVHAAVADRAGTLAICHRTTAVLPTGAPDEVVPAVRLDDYLDKRPRFLKIDAEGFEGFVLRGATALLATAPNLDLEVDERSLERFGMTTDETVSLVDWTRYETWIHDAEPGAFRVWDGRSPVRVRVSSTIMGRRR